jgi:hypothetical protein
VPPPPPVTQNKPGKLKANENLFVPIQNKHENVAIQKPELEVSKKEDVIKPSTFEAAKSKNENQSR